LRESFTKVLRFCKTAKGFVCVFSTTCIVVGPLMSLTTDNPYVLIATVPLGIGVFGITMYEIEYCVGGK